MPAELLELIPRSYDIIGSIAILELNRDIQQVFRTVYPAYWIHIIRTSSSTYCRFYEGWRCRGEYPTCSI